MKFAWEKYEELPIGRRNTLQVFITNKCNLNCEGCFAKNIMKGEGIHISIDEYKGVIDEFLEKGGEQITLLGGEPLLHPELKEMLAINKEKGIKTTIYTNGYFLNKFDKLDFEGVKLRISLYCKSGHTKSIDELPKTNIPFDVCFMVSKNTSVDELLETAKILEEEHNCNVFFISSIRELDNARKEFFDDTAITMNLLKYKELINDFLNKYIGDMEIHISKRGVFESTKTLPDNKCRFANYFISGKIIQCPYDVVNKVFQKDYTFNCRNCQQNNTCLMSKIVVKRKL
ncbi:radical SAM protein [archaeon]|jgi:organic radical activating enzyme|nr:radical SAM protein [archaeon]MBT4241670.1 radical SAM protein [archaeon]MBT4418065.1 radical SAM protein [archaeon]